MQNKVVWKEGLFIRPQHFQQNDRYVNYELRTRTINARANAWGLFDLKIDKSLLNTGQFILEAISGILPDGTLFNIDSTRLENLNLNITVKDTNKFIYLVLPSYINGSDDVHFDNQKDLDTRYKAIYNNEVPNTNSGENSVGEIVTAQYNFKLLFEDELENAYVKIAIAKIADVSASSNVSLDDAFVPTFLHLNASSKLISNVKEIVTMLSYRAEKLADKLTDTTMQSNELGNYLMLQVLNSYQSKFYFLITQDKIHPDELFLNLSTLAAELSVYMKKEKRLLKQFTYNHLEQAKSFSSVINELKDMLDMVLEQNSISMLIEKKKYGIFISSIRDKEMLSNSTFIFSVKADISTVELKDAISRGLKVGTIENIKNLVNFHLSGYKLKLLLNAPKEIPHKINHLYYSIQINDKEKEELLKSSGFAFHFSSEIDNINYAIWAIKNK